MSIQPISHPTTPDKVVSLVLRHDFLREGAKILDLGAGEGYLSEKIGHGLRARGLDEREILYAADIQPQEFQYKGIECVFGDFNKKLPFPDDYFDIVCLVEVIEHIEDQFLCIREISRILKPGGYLYVTTPNVLNINSRIRYFLSGLPCIFDILPYKDEEIDPAGTTGHINPVSLIYLAYMLKRNGLLKFKLHTDRLKRSGVAYALTLGPLIRLLSYPVFRIQRRRVGNRSGDNEDIIKGINAFTTMAGRSLIIEATKSDGSMPQRKAKP